MALHFAVRAAVVVFLLQATVALPQPIGSKERAVYLRLGAKAPVEECVFVLERAKKDEWFIHSTTGRGVTKMMVVSHYDVRGELLRANVDLKDKDVKKARVTVAGGKATVERDGQKRQEFDVPPGVIVTSAPDWTDTLLLCRRYDRAKGGKQEFAGLWVHPVQAAYLATFKVERLGTNKIKIDRDTTMELDRLLIELRPKSQYVAWADANGRMIKLAPLPFKEGTYSLVLQGFEKPAAALRP